MHEIIIAVYYFISSVKQHLLHEARMTMHFRTFSLIFDFWDNPPRLRYHQRERTGVQQKNTSTNHSRKPELTPHRAGIDVMWAPRRKKRYVKAEEIIMLKTITPCQLDQSLLCVRDSK